MAEEGSDRSGFTEEILFPETRDLGRLGRYELLALLGKGGMASVFLARLRGPSGFEKLLALKRIKPSLSEDPRFVKMFLDEARVAAALQHPNVAQVFELGNEGPTYFLAMEYLHGEHLGSVLARAARSGRLLPIDLVCWIGVRVAEALHHAHEATDALGRPLSIIHRDVSPQNIFVTYAGNVKLTDFGVAKASSNVVETDTGAVKGKYAYMAPEQALGGVIDRRVDVFALGIVLWEALTGRRLFRAENDAQTLLRVTRCDVPSLRAARPEVSEALDAIVHCALAMEPSGRFETAGALARALSRQCTEVSADEVRTWMHAHFQTDEERKRAFVTRVADQRAPEASASPLDEPTSGSGVVTRSARGSGSSEPAEREQKEAAVPTALPVPPAHPASSMRRSRWRVPIVLAIIVCSALVGVAGAIWIRERAEGPTSASATVDIEPAPAPVPVHEPEGAAPAVATDQAAGASAASAGLHAPSPEAPVHEEPAVVESPFEPEPSPIPPAREVLEVEPGTLEISISSSHSGARYGWVSVGGERRTLPAVIENVRAGPSWITYQIGEEPEQRTRLRVAGGRVTTVQLPR